MQVQMVVGPATGKGSERKYPVYALYLCAEKGGAFFANTAITPQDVFCGVGAARHVQLLACKEAHDAARPQGRHGVVRTCRGFLELCLCK